MTSKHTDNLDYNPISIRKFKKYLDSQYFCYLKKGEGGYDIFRCISKVDPEAFGLSIHAKKKIEILKIVLPKDCFVKEHCHEYITEYFFTDSNLDVVVDNKKISISNGDMLKISPEQWHKIGIVSDNTYFYTIKSYNDKADDKIFRD